MWKGLYPPQAIFYRRRFERVVLNPPEIKPGNWCGAGKLWHDPYDPGYWLTSRPRVGSERRGYAAEIYRSEDGASYDLAGTLSKEEISEMVGERVQSIENQQLLRDPTTGRFHLYLSLDVCRENVAGQADRVYDSRWETFLLTAEDPAGPWSGEGFVLRADGEYDSAEARDSTVDIIDGTYIALYKARRAGKSIVRMALATSPDGRRWRKHGILGLDRGKQPDFFLLNGSIMAASRNPVFVGIQTTEVVKGAALSKHFAAYSIDLVAGRLDRILLAPWEQGSAYEHPAYPIHTYSTIAEDPQHGRFLIMVEAVDPVESIEPGLNLEVDRVLLYTSPMP